MPAQINHTKVTYDQAGSESGTSHSAYNVTTIDLMEDEIAGDTQTRERQPVEIVDLTGDTLGNTNNVIVTMSAGTIDLTDAGQEEHIPIQTQDTLAHPNRQESQNEPFNDDNSNLVMIGDLIELAQALDITETSFEAEGIAFEDIEIREEEEYQFQRTPSFEEVELGPVQQDYTGQRLFREAYARRQEEERARRIEYETTVWPQKQRETIYELQHEIMAKNIRIAIFERALSERINTSH